MPPRLIYLDQLKWIELARAAHRKGSRQLDETLAFMREARDRGAARFPLSLAHFMETDHADAGRTDRLGSLMFEISDNYTLASPHRIVEHEVDIALALQFGARITVRPFELVAKGAAHAAGEVTPRLDLHDPGLGPQAQHLLERFAYFVFERTLLTGRDPITQHEITRADYSGPNDSFARELEERRERLLVADPKTRERALRANAIWDIIKPIETALELNAVGFDEFAALGMPGMDAMLDRMPSRQVELHLWRGWLKHPSRKASPHDLNDWAYVGAAAATCDGVVTEKFLGRLLTRPGGRVAANVTSDLAKIATL